MKRTLIFLLLLSQGTNAQISGKLENPDHEVIPYATVSLYQLPDSTFILGTNSDEIGEFFIPTQQPSSYYIKISSVGFADTFTSAIMIENETPIRLGLLKMTADLTALNEVVIRTKKDIVQQTEMGQVINVQNSLMTQGSSAMQVIERLPGVLVDKRNNQFGLNGQSGVTVLFNGRRVQLSMPDLMALLESTDANNIEKIELLTSPSAKYDADGGAGLINIVFKKNENEGQQLSLNTSVGYGYKEKANGSMAYSYGIKKVFINTGYSYFHDNSKRGFEGEGFGNQPIVGGPGYTFFSTYFHNNLTTHNTNFSLLYTPLKRTEIGGDVSFLMSSTIGKSVINNARDNEDKSFIRSDILSESLTRKKNLMSSVYWSQKVNDQNHLNLDFSYLSYSNDSPSLVKSKYFNREGEALDPENAVYTEGNRGTSISSIDLTVLKADYQLKIGSVSEGEFGIKGSYSINRNDSKIETNSGENWVVDPRSQSLIHSDEKLLAAYSQFKIGLSDKSTIHAGLRYEYWKRKISNNPEPFIISQVFPTFLFQHYLTDQTVFRFNYNRRISRPTYDDLISNLYYNDPTAVFTGNPLLKPTISDGLKLEFSIHGFNIGLTAQKELNPIIRYQITSTAAKDILILSPQNADYQNSLTMALNFPWQWASWAKLSLSSATSLRKFQISYTPEVATKKYLFQSLNFNQTFNLPADFTTEISGWWNFAGYLGHTAQDGFGVINLGISKKLKNDRGTVQFGISDLFKSFDIENHIGATGPIIFDIDTHSRYRDESGISRIFRLSYSRNFGSSSKRKRRNTGAEEEKSRVNK
ncbi:MAG: TonB-dependent receptor [Cytophagales bacterium]|nr:TonB-dependent receptor [Cytophagales bacterium]